MKIRPIAINHIASIPQVNKYSLEITSQARIKLMISRQEIQGISPVYISESGDKM
jgi:hypothetical protein